MIFDLWSLHKAQGVGGPNPLSTPKVQALGHDPDGRIKILSDMFHIFHM